MNIWEQSFDDLRRPYLEEKNDGNLANNYPPYDRVTRGDVIAGATGKDQMGGKKKKMKSEERKLGGGMRPGGGYDRGYKAMQKEIEKLESGKETAAAKRYKEMRNERSDWRSDLGFFTEEDCGSGLIKSKKGIKNKITINPDLKTEETVSEREMTSGEMQKEKTLKKKYDPSGMKASMKKQYGAEKGKQVYFATIRKQAMEQFAGNYEGPLYAPHPDIEEGYKEIDREKENKMYRRAGNLARTALSSKGKKKEDAMNKSSNIVSAITRQKEKERFDRIGQSPKHNEALENELDYYLGEALRPASERMKRVQTDAGRKKQEQKREKKSKLEAEADKILAGYSKKGTGLAKTKPMSERREMDEPGESDTNPDVRRHNKMVGYKSKPKRPSVANDPRYGTVQDRSGKFKY
jgi:hypothetical protein